MPDFTTSYASLRRVISTRLPSACLDALALDEQVLADDAVLQGRLADVDLDIGFLVVQSVSDVVDQLPQLTAVATGATPVAHVAVDDGVDLERFAVTATNGAAFKSMLIEATPIGVRLAHETALTRQIVGSVLYANDWLDEGSSRVRAFDSRLRLRDGSAASELPPSFVDAVCFVAGPFARSLQLAALPEVYGLLALVAAGLRVCVPAYSARHLAAKDWADLHERLYAAGAVLDYTGVVAYRTLTVAVRNARGYRRLPTSYVDVALRRLVAERDRARALALRKNPLLVLRVAHLVRNDDGEWLSAVKRLLSEMPVEAAALLRVALALAVALRDDDVVDGELLLSAEAVLALVLAAPEGQEVANALVGAACHSALASSTVVSTVAATRPSPGFTLATEAWAATVLILLQMSESLPAFDSASVATLPQVLRFTQAVTSRRPAAASPDYIRVATCNIDSASDLNVVELCTLLDEHDVDVVALQETAVARVTTLGTLPEGFHSIAIPSPTPTRSGDGRARRGLGFIARQSTFRTMFLDTFDPVLCAGQVDIKETETAYVRLQLHDGRLLILGSLYSPPVTFAERPGLGHMEHSTAPEPGAWAASIGVDIAARGARASVLLAGDFNEDPNFGRGQDKVSLSVAVEQTGLRLVTSSAGEALPTFGGNAIDRMYATGNVIATTVGVIDRGDAKHRLLIADVETASLGPPAVSTTTHRLRLARLRAEGVPEKLLTTTAARLSPLLDANADPSELEKTILDSAKDVLGTTSRISTRKMVSWWTQEVRTAVKSRVSSRRRLLRLRRKLGRANGARALQLALDAVEEARDMRRRDRVARQAVRTARRRQQELRARMLMKTGEQGNEALRQHFESSRYRTGKKSAAAGPSAHRSADFFRRLYSDEPLETILSTSMGGQVTETPVAIATQPLPAGEDAESHSSSAETDSQISLVSSSSPESTLDLEDAVSRQAYSSSSFSQSGGHSQDSVFATDSPDVDDDGGSEVSMSASSSRQTRYALRSSTRDAGLASPTRSSPEEASVDSSQSAHVQSRYQLRSQTRSGSPHSVAPSATGNAGTQFSPSDQTPPGNACTSHRYSLRSMVSQRSSDDSSSGSDDPVALLSVRSSPVSVLAESLGDEDGSESVGDSDLVEVVDVLDESGSDGMDDQSLQPIPVLSVGSQDVPLVNDWGNVHLVPHTTAPDDFDADTDEFLADVFRSLPATPEAGIGSLTEPTPPSENGGGLVDAGGLEEDAEAHVDDTLDRTGADGVLGRWRDKPLSVSGSVSSDEVLEAVCMMAQDKAPGIDLITGRVLRALCLVVDVTPQTVSGVGQHADVVEAALARDTCLEAIRRILDDPFRTGVWPDRWKIGITVVIPKGKVSADPKDGRGITLLPLFDKLAQRILTNRLHKGGRRTSVEQAGFVPSMGALQAAASAVNLLAERRARGVRTIFVSVDVQKAFDRVKHDGIIAGLRRIGADEHLCALIRSLLHGRSTRVLSNGELSDSVPIGRGVPQGGVVSPFLFNAAVDFVYEAVRPNGIELHDGTGRTSRIGGLGFADDTLLITDAIEKAQAMIDTTDQRLKDIGCDTHPGKLRFITSNVRRDGARPAGTVLTLRGETHKPVESLTHLGCYITGDAVGRRKRNPDRIARTQRWDRAAAGWKQSVNGLHVPMWIARLSFLGGLAASALYGVELDSVCWTSSSSGVAYDLSPLDQRFSAGMASVAGFSKRGGSRDMLSQVTGIPPLLDWLFIRVMRLLFLLKHSTCLLQRLLARQTASADVGLAKIGNLMLAELGLDDDSLISRMVNPFARTSDEPVKDLKLRLERLIRDALSRPRNSTSAPWLRTTTRQGTRQRNWPVRLRMAPGLRYAGLGARSVIHLLFGTLAARRGRSAQEANDASWCHLCGFRGGDNAEHIIVHCLHPALIDLRASLDARDILLILSSFAYDLDRSVRCSRSKKKWIARVADVVDDVARIHADAFHGRKADPTASLEGDVLRAQHRHIVVLETAVQRASAKAKLRNALFNNRVARLDMWASAFRGYIPTTDGLPVTVEAAALPDSFALHDVPLVDPAPLELPHDVGIDPTEIVGRRRKGRR